MSTIKDLSAEEKKQLIKALEKRNEDRRFNRMDSFFPDTGEFRRELYPKHLEFFKAGAQHKERAFIAANRCGKSISGAYETTCHLMNRYPDWWEGHRFNKPIIAWAIGVSAEQCRDVLQKEMTGSKHQLGTGFIPKSMIERTTHKSLPPDTIAEVYVKTINGGTSVLHFKNAMQGREVLQGSNVDFAWLDEEIDMASYSEVLLRTMACQGKTILTFTPLKGLSDLVLSFLPGGKFPTKAEQGDCSV